MLLTGKDKRIIVEWEELLDNIKSSTPVDNKETPGDKSKRIKRLLGNYEEFCKYYFEPYCFAPFSVAHKKVQSQVIDQPNNIFLEQWSRGFAKTTHFGLFVPLFLKFNGRLNGMIVGSHDETMAAEKLADIQANLQANARIINDFGEQYSYGNWEDGIFKTRDDVAFYGFGKRQSPRGSRFKWKRPNYGLVDDLNDSRQLKNEAIANEDKAWVLEELKPALWTREWWLVIAQNKFNDNTITALLEKDEEVKTKVHRVNITNEKGESNWPENPDFSKQAIEDLKATEGNGFVRERLNTPFEEGTIFQEAWLREWIDSASVKYDSIVSYLDPSYKSSDKSDYKAWVMVGKAGKYYDIIDCWVRKATSKEMWEAAYGFDAKYPKYTMLHSMEANFIQEEFHKKEYQRVEEDKNYPLRLLNDRRSKGDKFERICTLQPLFQRGLIRFNSANKSSADMKLLRSQLLAIEKGSRINDDAPDALEGAIWMLDRHAPRKSNKGARSGKYHKKSDRSI